MANRLFHQFPKTLEKEVVSLYAKVVTSTSGAIASQVSKGLTVSKVAGEAGRYLVTLVDYYFDLRSCHVMLATASADAAYTAGKGAVAILRNVSVSTSGKTFQVQFIDPATSLDAEIEDGATFWVEPNLKNSQAY